jgi:hypothetical protein
VTPSDDIRIGVVNEGPFEPTWFYDGKAYQYRVSTPEMIKSKRPLVRWIPLAIAYEHWAVQLTRDGKLERATDIKERDEESQWDNRLAGICPKRFYPQKDAEGQIIKDAQGRSLGAYDDDREFKEWFLHKVHFRMKKVPEYEEELA